MDWQRGIRVLLEKAFYYGAAIWLLRMERAAMEDGGRRRWRFCWGWIEIAQTHLRGTNAGDHGSAAGGTDGVRGCGGLAGERELMGRRVPSRQPLAWDNAEACPAEYLESADLAAISAVTVCRKSSTGTGPRSPRLRWRTATCPASASRPPMTSMYAATFLQLRMGLADFEVHLPRCGVVDLLRARRRSSVSPPPRSRKGSACR